MSDSHPTTEREREPRAHASHTPGPWNFNHGFIDPKWPDWRSIGIGGHSVSGHVGEANAQLIRSAPDLFAILNELHDEFDRQSMDEIARREYDAHDGDEFSVNITAKQLRAINQAILKAEGKL